MREVEQDANLPLSVATPCCRVSAPAAWVRSGARDANLDREVAIKLLNHDALDDATTRERFRREARVLSRLSHPGVATDIYAPGVMLFEMAARRRPFVKERSEALMFEIFNNTAPPLRVLRPDVPAAFETLVADCLGKEAALRPRSAAAVAESLRAIGSGAHSVAIVAPVRSTIRAIAVLPLRNVSRDAAQEYFADGMTEAIISDIARIKALRVISYTSSIKYKATDKSLFEIARELNVDAVLEGSALLLGDSVRVSVQLVSARADETLWADRYDRSLVNVLGLLNELAETVVREIEIQLTPTEVTQLAKREVVNPEAHLEFLKSRHSALQGSKDALAIAVKHARRALEIDPGFAFAWSALADCQIFRAVRGMAPAAEAGAEAHAAATRALGIAPSLGDAHASLTRRSNSTPASRSRTMSSPAATTRSNVTRRRSPPPSRSSSTRSPRSSAPRWATPTTSRASTRTRASTIVWLSRSTRGSMEPTRTLPARTRRSANSARRVRRTKRVHGTRAASPRRRSDWRISSAGHTDNARRILAELTAARATRVVSAWGIGALHASLGVVDDAFRWLEIAIAENASGLILLRVHPRLDPIRQDARYWPMVERVGLADR